MKCTIPEISWHNRDPVLSADIQHSSEKGFYRLATGGTDSHVVIWELNILDNGGVSVEMLSDLTRHNRAVNAVRFSPNGQLLASSDDEAAVILWKKSEEFNEIFNEESDRENKENWIIYKLLRNHIEDVYDLSWSSCSQFLVSGSVDNSAIIWDVHKGKSMAILKDHKGFVQGVAWDPKGQYIATISSDRCFRVFNITNKKIVNRAYKMVLPTSNENGVQEKTTRLFYDDTLKSFCRRLSFSPDGELIAVPSGILELGDGKMTNVTHIFTKSCLSRPVLCLPTSDKYTLAVRFCPLIFELKKRKSDEDSKLPYQELFNLPYRMVFAVATQNAVLMYDTQQPIPFAKVSNIHYTRLSDISWSNDGRILIVSSTDGYCSLVSFSEGELGVPYVPLNTKESDEILTPKSTESSEISFSQHTESDSIIQSNEILGPQTMESLNVENKDVLFENNAKDVSKQNFDSISNSVASSLNGKNNMIEETEHTAMEVDEELDSNSKTTVESEPKLKIFDNTKNVSIIPPSLIKRKPGKRVELITVSPVPSCKTNLSKSDEKKEEKQKVEEGNKNDLQPPLSTASPSGTSIPSPRAPRRVSLITLSSPKNKSLPS